MAALLSILMMRESFNPSSNFKITVRNRYMTHSPSKDALKTHQVISLKEAELVSHLKSMSLEELEFHAHEIMKDMGAEQYSNVMAKVMKSIEEESRSGYSQFETVQKTLEDELPNKAYLSDIYARLAAIVMTIISRRFKELL